MSECAGKACRRSACMRLNKNVYPISSSFLLHRAVLGFSSFNLPKLSLFLPWARPRTHIHGHTHRLENTGGGEEKHAIWTDEEAKGGGERRRKRRKMEVAFVVPHEEQTASAEETLASVLLTRAAAEEEEEAKAIQSVFGGGSTNIHRKRRKKKNARSSPTDAEKRIDMYSLSIYLFPQLCLQAGKKVN